jgi:hypothetical protein
MTWNSEGILCSGRELALLNLLTANDVHIGIITETEIPASNHGNLNIEGYHSYFPHQSNLLKAAKYRVVTLVRSALATSVKIRLDLMHSLVQLVWIQLDIPQGTPHQGTRGPPGTWVLINGLYREWSDLVLETSALSKVREQLQAASAVVDNVVLAGDVNLDTDSNNTEGNLEAANVVNTFYVEKVQKIRAGTRGVENRTRESATTSGGRRRYEGKKISFDFFLRLCERGPDCKGHHRAQVHVGAWHQWDPGGH